MRKARLRVDEKSRKADARPQRTGSVQAGPGSLGELCLGASGAGHNPGKLLSLPGVGQLGREAANCSLGRGDNEAQSPVSSIFEWQASNS